MRLQVGFSLPSSLGKLTTRRRKMNLGRLRHRQQETGRHYRTKSHLSNFLGIFLPLVSPFALLVVLCQLVLVKVLEFPDHGLPEDCRQRPRARRTDRRERLHHVRHAHPVRGKSGGGAEVAGQVGLAGTVEGGEGQEQVGGRADVQLLAAVQSNLGGQKEIRMSGLIWRLANFAAKKSE